ncbi:unnamed protein product [Dovyalis caffra]|uniref:Uncharacterized protein n=1 Tax=Dovyalis caffra TaxID=77055 RepID=A0AAV1SFZ7_9ROSI|nr:unnamed protein product [Dovyalis caffra]
MVDEKGPSERILLQQFGHSIHRPCQALLECNNENAPIAVEGRTRTENKRVIVRSRFFQHKSMNKNDQDNKQEMLSVKDAVASDMCADSVLEGSDNTRTGNREITIRTPFFQHKSVNENDQDNKQDMLSVKDAVASDMCEDSVLEGSDNKRTGNRGITLRSSFFQHKSVDENDQDNKQERLFVRDDAANNIHEDFILESPSEDKFSNCIIMKRKTSPNDSVQRNMEAKHICTDASLPDNGSDPHLNKTLAGKKFEEQKFGSDISHISHYSNIAEKSIERFVSVISSFRYNSTGSRASGLRAPLKNIQNTCANSHVHTRGLGVNNFVCSASD